MGDPFPAKSVKSENPFTPPEKGEPMAKEGEPKLPHGDAKYTQEKPPNRLIRSA